MMPTVVAACAILHNMREIHGDKFDEEWLLDVRDSRSQAHAQNMDGQQTVAEGQAGKYELPLPNTSFPTL